MDMRHVNGVLKHSPVATLELDLSVDRLPDGILQLYCTPAQSQSMLMLCKCPHMSNARVISLHKSGLSITDDRLWARKVDL